MSKITCGDVYILGMANYVPTFNLTGLYEQVISQQQYLCHSWMENNTNMKNTTTKHKINKTMQMQTQKQSFS